MITNESINIRVLNYLYENKRTMIEIMDNLFVSEKTAQRQIKKINLLDMIVLKKEKDYEKNVTYYRAVIKNN